MRSLKTEHKFLGTRTLKPEGYCPHTRKSLKKIPKKLKYSLKRGTRFFS
jgi:hypothetical protein